MHRSSPLISRGIRVDRQPALLATLTTGVFMVNLDSRVVSPLLPTVGEDFHISIAQSGWLVSSYLLPYGLFQLVYGPLADRHGKVTASAYAMVAFSAGTAMCGSGNSFVALVVVRALTGAAAAALIPLTLAYVGDTVAYERRQAAIASLMAASGAAQAFSTCAGGTLATLISWRAVFPVLGIMAGCGDGRYVRFAQAPRLRFRAALTVPATAMCSPPRKCARCSSWSPQRECCSSVASPT